jgi:hypothetical protein
MGRGVSITFPVSGDYRHVRRQSSGWRSDAENAIKLEKKNAGRSGQFPLSAFRHGALPLYLLFFLRHIVQRCPVHVQIRAVPPMIKINIRHEFNPVSPLALPLDPILGVPGREVKARTSAAEVAVAWLRWPPAQTLEFTAAVRWNQRICLERFWWLAATPSRGTSQSESSPSGRAFQIACLARFPPSLKVAR